MTEQTRCPSCGAPLTFVGDQDVVSCDFCNTQLRVLHEGGEDRYEIVSQPAPQAEVLSQPVDPEVEDVLMGERAPLEEPEIPAAPFTIGSSDTLFTPPPPVVEPAFSGASGGAQVYGPTGASTPARSGVGGLPRWAIIVIAVVALLCLLCACAGGAIALLANAGFNSY